MKDRVIRANAVYRLLLKISLQFPICFIYLESEFIADQEWNQSALARAQVQFNYNNYVRLQLLRLRFWCILTTFTIIIIVIWGCWEIQSYLPVAINVNIIHESVSQITTKLIALPMLTLIAAYGSASLLNAINSS